MGANLSGSISEVKRVYGSWIQHVFSHVRQLSQPQDQRLREAVHWHLYTMDDSKGVRPALVGACYVADEHLLSNLHRDLDALRAAAAVELIHRSTLAVDDLIDDSPKRGAREALHVRYSPVMAGAVAMWLNCMAQKLLDDNARARQDLRILANRLALGEVLQERWSKQEGKTPPATWQEIADLDTGALFDFTLAMGRKPSPAFAYPLARLRHGLDDIEDLLDPEGDQRDVAQGTPTLPTVFTEAKEHAGLVAAIPRALAYLETELERVKVYVKRKGMLRPFVDDFERQLRGYQKVGVSADRDRSRP